VDLGLEVHELDMSALARRRIPLLAALLTLAAAALPVSHACASIELVKNGLLAEGQDGKPTHWRNEGYATDATTFTWTSGPEGLGVLLIDSAKPNDARWVQSVPVSPGTWYQITAWVRTEDVGAQSLGAYLSVMDTFYNSRDLRGTVGWQQVGFWVKTGSLETSLPLACRLGGYSSLNTGRAYCTGISVVAAGTPRAGEPFLYGGDPGSAESSGDLPIAKGVAVLVAIGVVLLAWRYLASPAARIPP